MSTNPAIYCVGIIGKENEPIYIESFSTDDNADTTLKHQYQVCITRLSLLNVA